MKPPFALQDSDLELRERVASHFSRAASASACLTDPFPHVEITGCFPEDVYERMLASIPDASLYEAVDYNGPHVAGPVQRKRFRLARGFMKELPFPERRFWFNVRAGLGSEQVQRAVFGALAAGLAFRYGIPVEQVPDLPGYPLPELYQETQGYSIAPHPDTRKKIVTMQIPLTEDEVDSGLGTEFYRRSLNPASWFREPRGFETVKRAPFRRNTATAFVVLNSRTIKSWHGRTRLSDSKTVRNTILTTWMEDPTHANRCLIREQIALGLRPDVLPKAA